jgi:tetratricopeptide (TPR) repeat protein
VVFGIAMIPGWAATRATVGPPIPIQAPGAPTPSADKDLEAAARKVREGRHDEALGLIREQAARHPEWPPPPLILARLLSAAGQGAPARRALEQAAVEAPGHPEVYLTFGSLALAEGRLNDARLNFEAAMGLIGAGRWDADRSRLFRRESLAGLASVAEAREDWSTALDRLNAWLELEPQNGPARQRLGAVLFRLGRPEEAFSALERAVKDAPTLEPAAVTMARLWAQRGDQKKAEEWFDRARDLEPTSARVRIARAAWLFDQGRVEAARPVIDEALKLDPTSRDARRIQGLIAWHLRDLAAAERILESLHRDAPTDLAAADLLSLCLVEQDDAAKRSRGLQLAEADARQSPGLHEALATLGWAHYRSGHLDEAERLLRAAVQGVRTSPDIAYFLARVLADKGRTDDARNLLRSANNLPGAFAHRADARTLLESLSK